MAQNPYTERERGKQREMRKSQTERDRQTMEGIKKCDWPCVLV